jgi:hypothetical protein
MNRKTEKPRIIALTKNMKAPLLNSGALHIYVLFGFRETPWHIKKWLHKVVIIKQIKISNT